MLYLINNLLFLRFEIVKKSMNNLSWETEYVIEPKNIDKLCLLEKKSEEEIKKNKILYLINEGLNN